MMRKLVYIPTCLFLALLLAACASSPDVRWAQAQKSYNSTARVLEMYRGPCVDREAYVNAGPDHPLCRVDDATWAVVYPIMQDADKCLKAADAQLQSGAIPTAQDAIACAERALERLLIYQLSTPGS